MSQENVEIIRRANAAFNRGDVQVALESYSREIEWRDLQHPPDSPELVRGIEAVERILSGWLDAFPDLRGDVREFIDAGDVVICVTNWRGMGKGSGTPVDEVTAETFELRHGEIVRATFGYRSKDEALEAAGLSESAMPTENVEIVRAAIDAWNRQDAEAVIAMLGPEPEYVNSPTAVEPGVRSGMDEVSAAIRALSESLTDAQWEIDRIYDRGEEVIALGRLSRRMPAGEARLEDRSFISYKIRSRKIVQIQVLGFGRAEVQTALEAAGLSE